MMLMRPSVQSTPQSPRTNISFCHPVRVRGCSWGEGCADPLASIRLLILKELSLLSIGLSLEPTLPRFLRVRCAGIATAVGPDNLGPCCPAGPLWAIPVGIKVDL